MKGESANSFLEDCCLYEVGASLTIYLYIMLDQPNNEWQINLSFFDILPMVIWEGIIDFLINDINLNQNLVKTIIKAWVM